MWFFRSPTVVFGEDALLHIRELRGKKAFVVTDKIISGQGILAPVLFQLQHAGMSVQIFDAVTPEPGLELIEEGADQLDAYGADWIVAVGGGSVIDAAKAMWVLYENPDLDLESVSPLEPIKLRERARMIAVPTTAGTGSEVTWAYVVTLPGENGGMPRKFGSGHPLAVPDYAIVDPVMSVSMPDQVAADTGMDALVQAIEGYVGTWSNEFSDGLCLVASKLCFDFLERSCADASDHEAREKMAIAASVSGLGYINSMVGLAHAMGHALGAAFKLPHGRLVGLCVPAVLEFYADGEASARCVDLLRFLGDASVADDANAAARALAAKVRGIAAAIGQPASLRAAGVEDAAFAAALNDLVDHAMGDTTIFTSPRQPSEDELRRLFACVQEGGNVDF